MALELYALLPQRVLPQRQQWQAAIEALGLPVVLDPELDLPRTTGFRPCIVSGQASGCEIMIDSPVELVAAYPALQTAGIQYSTAISLRWGGDLRECACAMAAAAGLVSSWGAVAYYPDDDLVYSLADLQRDFRECVS